MKLLELLETFREDEVSGGPGKFVGARLTRDSERAIMQWMRDNGLRKKEPRARLHITVVGDAENDFPWNPATFDPPLEIDPHTYKLERFGDDALVLSFSVPELEKRHEAACSKHGIDWKHPTYQPHLTLSFDPKGLNNMERLLKPTFPLYVASEYAQPWEFKEGDDRYERRRRIREDREFLAERNLMNAPWAKEVAQQYAEDTFFGAGGFTDLPHLGTWATKALAKYLINDYPAAIRINSFVPGGADSGGMTPGNVARHQPAGADGEVVGQANVTTPRVPQFGIVGGRDKDMPLSVPAWVPGALERGDDIYFLDNRSIQGTNGLPQQMTLVRDWFRMLARTEDPVVMQPGRINRMSWLQALEKAEQWHEAMVAGESNVEELEGHKEKYLDFGDGNAWWKLTGESCLNREGEIMGHCVADYVDEVESGYSVIYSLRDRKNNPHVTVEVQPFQGHAGVRPSDNTPPDGWAIEQVKGKENKPPVQKYWGAVDHLLRKMKTEATLVPGDGEGEYDLGQMGLVIAPNGDIARIKAHGDAGDDPEQWEVEWQGTVDDMGKSMEYEEEMPLAQLAERYDYTVAELLIALAKNGEFMFHDESVAYPLYPWSYEKIG